MNEEKKEQVNQLPEAPASVNVDYKRSDGFIIKLTLRDETGIKVLDRLDAALNKIKEKGGLPYEKSFQKQAKPVEYVPDRLCPICGDKLVYATKKDGERFIKCSTNKWNFALKQSEGCQFVEFKKKTNTEEY